MEISSNCLSGQKAYQLILTFTGGYQFQPNKLWVGSKLEKMKEEAKH